MLTTFHAVHSRLKAPRRGHLCNWTSWRFNGSRETMRCGKHAHDVVLRTVASVAAPNQTLTDLVRPNEHHTLLLMAYRPSSRSS